MAEFATRAIGNAGLTTGIIGSALGVLNGGLGNILGGNMNVSGDNAAVSRYEAKQSARIAELEGEVKFRDSTIYTDGKLLDLYKYFNGEIKRVDGKLCEQAVYNATNTATIGCMAQQINQLLGLTKLVIPNANINPGWGNVQVSVVPTTTAGA